MNRLRFTLLADGPSDRCLRLIIEWTLLRLVPGTPLQLTGQMADLRILRTRPATLAQRLQAACSLYPCHLLFVHRDAEREPIANRLKEVRSAASGLDLPTYVPVVPVRMTEAWLLIDEAAIRRAADNPNGTVPLNMPPLKRLEGLADPKKILQENLILASEKSGRHLDRFKRQQSWRVQRVAELIDDFQPLRTLEAFRIFEEATREVLPSLLRPKALRSDN